MPRTARAAARQGAPARRALGLFAFALGAFVALPEAEAQQPSFYLDRLYVAGAPEDGIGIWRPHVAEKTRFFGQLGLGFGFNAFRHENHLDARDAARLAEETSNPVQALTMLYLTAGVEFLDRFAVQVEQPFTVFQTGGATTGQSVQGAAIQKQVAAVADTKLEGRVVLLRNASRSFKLGAQAGVWLPSGNELSFAGDLSTHGHVQLGAEYDLKKFFVTVNTGVHFRPEVSVNQFDLGNEWTWGLGAFVPLRDGKLRLGVQLFGSTGLTSTTTFAGPNTPVEWLAEGRFALDEKRRGWLGVGGGTRLTAGYSPDFRVVGVLGYSFGIADTDPNAPGKKFRARRSGGDADKDGILDDIDLCPTEPEDGKPPNPDDGCPALPDRDGDGIPDISDKCPDKAEDFDKIDDRDGCPEDDADEDGIADAMDACPKEPGDPSPEPAKNGCPQFIRRITGSNEIQILQQIQFETGSARIKADSNKILDEVYRLIKVNPEIEHVAIEGHTDNRGSDELNEKLSQDRAESVRQYLINKGIAADRLSAKGYGPKRPIDDNNTAEGRQKNRRVEFHIRNKETTVEKRE